MAFCSQCGHQVGEADQFCSGCGRAQATSGGPTVGKTPVGNAPYDISDHNAAMLCYVPWLGWIPAIVVLATDQYRQNRNLRFHAFQGLYLFVAYLFVDWFVSPMFRFGVGFPGTALPRLLSLVVFAGWILMLVKIHQGEDYHLPIIGDLAEKSAAENSR